jgi:hypothetical protein
MCAITNPTTASFIELLVSILVECIAAASLPDGSIYKYKIPSKEIKPCLNLGLVKLQIDRLMESHTKPNDFRRACSPPLILILLAAYFGIARMAYFSLHHNFYPSLAQSFFASFNRISSLN